MNKTFNCTGNFFLSIFGIYLSFFYFGYSGYFYPQYETSDILKNGFLISAFLSIPVIILEYFSYKNKLIKRISITFIYSFVIYTTYHLLFRFSDISYFSIYSNLFSSNNKINKIIFYFYPFFISILIFTFLNGESIKKLGKFILILLIILNIISIPRLTSIYNNSETTSLKIHDFKNFNNFDLNQTNSKSKKIFFLIFDEFDQLYLEKKLDEFDYLKKLYKVSYVNKNFYSPAKFTMGSIPAILTGNSIKKFKIKKKELFFYDLNNQKIHFNYKNSIFNQNLNKKISSSIYSYYHPYCRIFKVKYCYDVYDPKKVKINFIDTIRILSDLLYVNRIFKIEPFELKNDNLLFSEFVYKNNNNFLLSDTDIVFVHYPYPHLPLKTKNIIRFENNLSDYDKNLWLVEKTLSNAKNIFDKFQNSLLIITSDHWLRVSSQEKALPVVFISKIIGDDIYYQNTGSNNGSSIKGLITLFFEDKVKNNLDIKNYFDNQFNHETYIRFN